MKIERLGVRRFKKAASVAEAYATDALEAALDAIRNGEIVPEAVTVVVLDEDGGVTHFSAGDADLPTLIGMMEIAKGLFTSRGGGGR